MNCGIEKLNTYVMTFLQRHSKERIISDYQDQFGTLGIVIFYILSNWGISTYLI
jgi:hypothetical protein